VKIEARRTAWLTIASGLGRIPGFLIPVLVAALFGAGSETDAYFLAYNAVLLVGGTLAQSIELSIVPFAARELLHSEAAARRFLTGTAVRASAVAGGLWLVVVPVLIGGANAAVRWHVAGYAACFTPLVLLWCVASVHSGALVAERDIAAATGSMMWRGLGGLLGFALAPVGGGLWSVGVGLGAGELARTAWLRRRVFARARQHVPIDTTPRMSFPHAAAAIAASGFLLSAVPLIEKMLALRLGPGAASHLEYATRLLIVPAVVFDGALAPQLLAGWSRGVVAAGHTPSRRDVWTAVRPGLVIACGLAALLAGLAPQIVALLLHHGRFSVADATAVSRLLRLLAIGFVGSMGSLLVGQAYFATSRSKLFAVLTALRGVARLAVVLALLGSLGLMAFGVGFAVAEWGFLVALLIGVRAAPAASVTTRAVEA
jgi:putative peptidoglycan lipid II flippase